MSGRGRALLAALALLPAACGQRAAAPSPSPSPSPSGPPTIRPPDPSLLPVVRPPGIGLAEGSLQRIRRRELYLEGLLAEAGYGKDRLATAYGELGSIYLAHGLAESAGPCYENASRLQPSAFEWPYLAARAYWQREHSEEALAAVQRALAIRPDDVAALVFQGDLHRTMGGVEPARKAYTRALEVSPRCPPALYGLGTIASLEGNFRRAVELFEAALRAQPEASRIHYPLSVAYGRLGNAAQSKRHLALRGDIDLSMADPLYDAVLLLNPFTYARRGQDALQAGNVDLALELLRPASEALPEDPQVRMHLGAALARSGDLEGALAQYREAVRLQPTNPHAHYNLGTTLTSLGRDEEALVSLRRAVELHPEFRQALFNLAQALRRLDRHAEALPLLEKTLEVAPTHEPARLALARVLARLGRCREAVASAEEGLAALPQSSSLKALLGRLLAACTTDSAADPARALKLAQQAFTAEATAENAASVAFVYAARGAWKEAAQWQRRAVGLHPAPDEAEALSAKVRDYEAGRLEVDW